MTNKEMKEKMELESPGKWKILCNKANKKQRNKLEELKNYPEQYQKYLENNKTNVGVAKRHPHAEKCSNYSIATLRLSPNTQREGR
jgi:hypothetical protein